MSSNVLLLLLWLWLRQSLSIVVADGHILRLVKTVIDTGTFLGSAYLVWIVGGQWNAFANANDQKTTKEEEQQQTCWCQQLYQMTVDGYRYLTNEFFGPFVLLKASASIQYGSSDVLNVSFAHHSTTSSTSSSSVSSVRLGLLFGAVGVGCVVGPLVGNYFSSSKRLETYQTSCLVSLAVVSSGCLGIGLLSSQWFGWTCLFSMLRAMGGSTVWTHSTVLLQASTQDTLHSTCAMCFS